MGFNPAFKGLIDKTGEYGALNSSCFPKKKNHYTPENLAYNVVSLVGQ